MGNRKSKKTEYRASIQKEQIVSSKEDNKSDKKEELEYALKILDRTDSWINSCDNKLSILVGVCGVVLTLFITTESISKAYGFIKTILFDVKNLYSYLFLASTAILVVTYGVTCFHVISSVVARVNIKKYSQEKLSDKSNIFFGSIANRKYGEYKASLSKSSDEEKMDDVISQIYINSLIAQKKYDQYNKSLIWMIVSALATILVIIWGIVGF